MKIASLEDDEAHAAIMSRVLHEAGYECATFSTGRALNRRLREEKFDMLIVDWELPDTSGRDFILWFRTHFGHDIPVLFVTARNMEEDIISGLSAGADDYLTKPIRTNEFVARVRALLRRAYPSAAEDSLIEVGPYRVDVPQKTIHVHEEPITLTPREFDLARLLFQNLGRLLPRDLLMQAVWGRGAEIASRTLDTHLSRVRTKLKLRPENGVQLVPVYSRGYRLEPVAVRDGAAVAVAGDV